MKRSRLISWTIAAFIAAALSSPSLAHDVWLTFAGDAKSRRVLVNYGHPEDRPPTVPDKILDLVIIKSGEKASLLAGVSPTLENGFYVVTSRPFEDDGHILIATRYDNGFWTKTADGVYRNATRRLVPDAVESVWSSKFAKAFSGSDTPWGTVLGHTLELVPLSDPAIIRPGESLRLRILFQGKPLAGAEVERGDGTTALAEKDIPRFTSDAEGIVSIPIVNIGPQLLVLDHRVSPSAAPEQANADLFAATFWFKIK